MLLLVTFAALAATSSPADPPRTCTPKYTGAVIAKWAHDGRKMELQAPFAFEDEHCVKWKVPTGAIVDGATIPSLFWPIVGGPYEGGYRDASVIHDWYCDRRTMPWKTVHRMFYEAMLASGVPIKKAKLLYGAVYYGGPRWNDQAVQNNTLPDTAYPTTVSVTVVNAMASNPNDPAFINKPATTATPVPTLVVADNLGPPTNDMVALAERIKKDDLSIEQIEASSEQLRTQRIAEHGPAEMEALSPG